MAENVQGGHNCDRPSWGAKESIFLMKTLNFVASQSILKIHVFFLKSLAPQVGWSKSSPSSWFRTILTLTFFLKKRRFQKHFKILLRNEAQTVRLCGFDVMKIIENRRHPRDFEDLKQLFNSLDLGGGDTTFLLKIIPKTVEPFLNPPN